MHDALVVAMLEGRQELEHEVLHLLLRELVFAHHRQPGEVVWHVLHHQEDAVGLAVVVGIHQTVKRCTGVGVERCHERACFNMTEFAKHAPPDNKNFIVGRSLPHHNRIYEITIARS